jgi:hypothetical protein
VTGLRRCAGLMQTFVMTHEQIAGSRRPRGVSTCICCTQHRCGAFVARSIGLVHLCPIGVCQYLRRLVARQAVKYIAARSCVDECNSVVDCSRSCTAVRLTRLYCLYCCVQSCVLQVLRYGEGQQYKPHMDSLSDDVAGPRLCTILLYLNGKHKLQHHSTPSRFFIPTDAQMPQAVSQAM